MELTLLYIYGAGLFLLTLFAVLVVHSFLRYRFVGDVTHQFIIIFAILFAVFAIGTLFLLRSGTDSSSTTPGTNSIFK